MSKTELSADRTVKLWEAKTGKNTKTLKGHTGFVYSVAFGPDGKTLASGSFDKTIRLWDVASGKSTKALKGHTSVVFSVAFSPDGKTLASGSGDQTIKLWQLTGGKPQPNVPGGAVPRPKPPAVVRAGRRGTGLGSIREIKLWAVPGGQSPALCRAVRAEPGLDGSTPNAIVRPSLIPISKTSQGP